MSDSFVAMLRRGGRWLVTESGSDVTAVFPHGGRPISLSFSRGTDGSYRIGFPKYTFQPKNSHYAPMEAERRNTCNKELLFSIVNHLKATGAWDLVVNKNFFRVNTENKNVEYKEASRNMRLVVDGFATPKRASSK